MKRYGFHFKDLTLKYFLDQTKRKKSFKRHFKIQKLSVTQKQGIITCIPKEGKNREYLKNWRPISLLSVDLKIGSSAIAARIKSVLDKLISESQSGFIKGRYIGDCNRLVFDLLEKNKERKYSWTSGVT